MVRPALCRTPGRFRAKQEFSPRGWVPLPEAGFMLRRGSQTSLLLFCRHLFVTASPRDHSTWFSTSLSPIGVRGMLIAGCFELSCQSTRPLLLNRARSSHSCRAEAMTNASDTP